jgi:HD-GYP domain-containing protein (c-di-GMP phosphodiesterase class II)
VADAYEAMTNDRSYRPALTEEEAQAELRDGSGTQFDPQVVDAFLHALAREPRLHSAAAG